MSQRSHRNVTLTDEVWDRLRTMSREQGFDSASRMIEWLVKREWERRAAGEADPRSHSVYDNPNALSAAARRSP